MGHAFEGVWTVAASLLGLAVFFALMWAIARVHAFMWRRVSAQYVRRGNARSSSTKLETIVIAQRGVLSPFNGQVRQYAGTLLSASDHGLSLSLIPMPPLNILAPPIFLPFDEMTLASTNWALWPEPFAIRMKRLPEIDIIIGRETVAWIRGRADRPPFGWEI